jgi:hypothetical protein
MKAQVLNELPICDTMTEVHFRFSIDLLGVYIQSKVAC